MDSILENLGVSKNDTTTIEDSDKYATTILGIPMGFNPDKTIETLINRTIIGFEKITEIPPPTFHSEINNAFIKRKLSELFSEMGSTELSLTQYAMTTIRIPMVYHNDGTIKTLAPNVSIHFVRIEILPPLLEHKISNSFIKEKISELFQEINHSEVFSQQRSYCEMAQPELVNQYEIKEDIEKIKHNIAAERFKNLGAKFLTEESKGKKKKKKEREPSPEVHIREKPKPTINFIN